MRWRQSEGGYILPATIILGLAISIASATFLQYTASTSDSLNGQSYTIYAQEAAKAGIAYANSCVRTGNASWSVPLTPDLSCDQATTNGSHYVTVSSLGDWRSTFSVSSPSTASSFGSSEYSTVSTGIVELLQNGSVTKRIYATKIVDFQKTTAVRKPSTGLSLTAIRGDTQMCSIANGKLYCWGSNSYGQIGDGTTTDRTTPTLVNGHGAITANMIVSEVSTSNRNTCAIADGQGYCWGENSHGQIGDTTNVQKTVPTAIAGPLAGKKITDLTIGAQNLPYIADEADEHACAIYNGVAYCWGSNGYTQLTDSGGCSGSCYTSTPVAVYGYNSPTNTDSPLYGKKMSRLASSSHDTCSVTQGHVYCWGVEAPVPPLCTVYFYYFEPNPGSLCDGVYGDFVNYYDVHATAAFTGAASDLNNRIVDPASFQMSTDLMCTMASLTTTSASDFICFGKSPALGYLWSGAYNPATIVTGFTNPDITDMDNGESPDLFFTIFPPGASGGLFGYVCAVDAGISKCTSQSESYTGTSGAAGFQQLTTSTGTPAMQGLATTKIAAGSHAVCLIPNGQLYCYGSAATGALANNSTGTDLPNATLTGTMTNGVAGSTKIGTLGTNLASNPTNFTFAASGSISVGGGHACGIVNGDVYCWGKNDYGQDGTGDTTDVAQPTTPPLTAGTVADKVSAGGSHTCAISKNQLYCWGRNDNGQLGMGNTTSPILVPTLVTAFAGKRVTDVSAGLNGTCAIANGQAYCWGKNDYGQAGTTIGQQNSPVAVSGITADATGNGKVATSISMGDRHACAVVNGDAYCWGSNANCALAIALCVGTYSSAQKVTGGSMSGSYNNLTSNNVTGVSAGNDFSCAIVNNNVACWGLNTSGQVGTNSATGNITTPSWIKDSSGTPITAEATTISAGSQHACATLQGVIYCWGENGNSQLGDTTATDKIYAEPITGGDTNCNGTTCAGDTSSGTVQATINVAAGGDSTCSVSNAKILCWGDSSNGRVGNLGAAGNTSLPLGTSNYVFQVPYYKGPIF